MTRLRDRDIELRDRLARSPTREILADLAAGTLMPTASVKELARRYGKVTPAGFDLQSCMTLACAAHAGRAGAVLIITDRDNTTVFGQIADPGHGRDNVVMVAAYNALAASVPADAVVRQSQAQRAKGLDLETVEFPISVMPSFDYAVPDGPAVGRYGDYMVSHRAPVALN